jgi:ABC-2 type transport system ATP-binding protein
MIQVESLVKVYRDVTAVDDLTFAVAPGEVLGLVGPNGAGKTTTLRCMAGILPPTSGRLRIAGFDL